MKTSAREPYGKSAKAFTDGFTLTFEGVTVDAIDHPNHILRFEQDWVSHFGAPPFQPNPLSRPRQWQR